MKRKASFITFVFIVAIVVCLDQAAKRWASSVLGQGATGFDFGIVDFTLVHNAGAAFGMGQGATGVFVGITIVIALVAVLWIVLRSRHQVVEVVGLSLLVAGGLGNLIDRVTCGYVVDFIEFTFIDFPVFNVADICVTCGVVLFFCSMIFLVFRDDVA